MALPLPPGDPSLSELELEDDEGAGRAAFRLTSIRLVFAFPGPADATDDESL